MMTVTGGRLEADDTWTNETIAWEGLVIPTGVGDGDGPFATGTHTPPPVVFASITSFQGSDPAGVRLRNVSDARMEAKVEEESGGGDPETSHVYEAIRYVGFGTGTVEDTFGTVVGETQRVRHQQPDRETWRTVEFEESYDDPVAFAQVASFEGSDPCHARLRNVGSDSLEVKVEEWWSENGPHTEERLDVAVFERGTHELPDGSPLEVRTVETDDGWTNDVGFDAAFGQEPAVVSRTQTFNGRHEVVTRHRNLDEDGIDVRLQEETGRSGGHTTETVGLLATPRRDVALGFGRASGVSDEWHEVTYETAARDPVVLTSVETYEGGDPVGTRLRDVTATGAGVKLEEETSGDDSETTHVDETVGFVLARSGSLWDGDGNRIGEAGTLRTDQPDRDTWHTLSFEGVYEDPVVFTEVMSHEGDHPAHTRVRNVTSDACEFQIEEWSYLNGPHTTETIGYLVVDAGTHTLPDGAVVHVGTTTTGDSWTGVAFGPDFETSQPTLLTRCQTQNGADEVVTRVRNHNEVGFEVRLQEETGRSRGHTDETIGFLGIARPGRTVPEYRIRTDMDAGVEGFLPSTCGFHFQNSSQFGGGYTITLPDWIPEIGGEGEIGDASNGMCGGMMLAARDYFEHGVSPWSQEAIDESPPNSPVSEEVPTNGSPLFDYLSERLFDSFREDEINELGALMYRRLMNVPNTTGSGLFSGLKRKSKNAVMNEHWHQHIKPRLEDGLLCPMGLIHVYKHKRGEPTIEEWGDNHQVLAYGYKQSGDVVEIYVYDPNHSAGDRDDEDLSPDDVRIQFTLHDDVENDYFDPTYNGSSKPLYGFFTMGYSSKNPPDF